MKRKPANVRVAHVRFRAADGSIDNRGGITVAAEIGDNHQVVKYAIARCHSKDNYNREHGWNKAVGRVASNGEHKVPSSPIEWRDLVKIYRDYAASGSVFDGTI